MKMKTRKGDQLEESMLILGIVIPVLGVATFQAPIKVVKVYDTKNNFDAIKTTMYDGRRLDQSNTSRFFATSEEKYQVVELY